MATLTCPASYYEQSRYSVGSSMSSQPQLSRRNSDDSEHNSLYRGGSSIDHRPLLPLNPSMMSTSTISSNAYHAPPPARSLTPRRSSESMRVLPTQPRAHSQAQDRAFSFSGERPNMHPEFGRPPSVVSTTASVIAPPRRAPVVYPALLSRVAEAFKSRITVTERLKDGLVYSDTFDGRDAVDKIAFIIKTTDRNLALLLGRALDAQKFFHDVTYDHRLRDSPVELYQFKERMAPSFIAPDDGTLDANEQVAALSDQAALLELAEAQDDTPSGVFTLLTDCYSPTCTRDRLCYSIACPRRLEQQARLNLKPKGLQRSMSSESLTDLPVRTSDRPCCADKCAGAWVALDPHRAAGGRGRDVGHREEAAGSVQRGVLHGAGLCARHGVPPRRASYSTLPARR